MNKWNYGGHADRYNMDVVIKAGTGEVMVHDIFNPLPLFMLKADVIFCDPPCSQGNLQSFYTKADKKLLSFFDAFVVRLFECIDEIAPKAVFIEVFASNKDLFIDKLKERYKNVIVHDSYYYHNKKNKCWVLEATNNEPCGLDIDDKDEANIIKEICANYPFDCIGDLCMGRGLVGFYANKAGRPFVGTELNKNRLAVLLHRIENGKI